jgi:hypothetical protein
MRMGFPNNKNAFKIVLNIGDFGRPMIVDKSHSGRARLHADAHDMDGIGARRARQGGGQGCLLQKSNRYGFEIVAPRKAVNEDLHARQDIEPCMHIGASHPSTSSG